MKKLLKKITEINEKYWNMVFQNRNEYNIKYTEYMASIEKVIQQYVISNCDCKDNPSATIEWVCEHCGRVRK